MKTRVVRGVIVVTVIAAVGVFSANAFAWRGHGPGGWGEGPCAEGPYAANLSAEQLDQLKELRDAFFGATADLRREVHRKHLALRSELAGKTPDPAAAKALQQEISDLRAQLAEKRIDHLLAVKKIHPDAGFPLMTGGGPGGRWMGEDFQDRGPGPGRGKGWHRGPGYGGGRCAD